jgi:tetratricopeptide (TPR) repeat protein
MRAILHHSTTLSPDDAVTIGLENLIVSQNGAGCCSLIWRENQVRRKKVIRRGLEVDESLPNGYAMLGMTLLRLDRLEEAERSAHEVLLRNPNLGLAYLVLADVHVRRGEYWMQLRELDAYLKLDPTGPASVRVHQAREVALRMLGQPQPQH